MKCICSSYCHSVLLTYYTDDQHVLSESFHSRISISSQVSARLETKHFISMNFSLCWICAMFVPIIPLYTQRHRDICPFRCSEQSPLLHCFCLCSCSAVLNRQTEMTVYQVFRTVSITATPLSLWCSAVHTKTQRRMSLQGFRIVSITTINLSL